MERKNITCIICPLSCKGQLLLDDKGNMIISGFDCKRGEQYALNECTSPKRLLTTTVKVEGSIIKRLPVVSTEEIEKNKLIACLEYLHSIVFQAPISAEEVLVEDLLGTNVDIIACLDIPKSNS